MKNHESIIKNVPLFTNKKLLITTLSGGLTNVNYKISTGKNIFVARFGPKNPLDLGISQQLGMENYEIAEKLGIGPGPIKFFPKLNLLIVKYIDGKTATPKSIRQKGVISDLGKFFNKLNNGPKLKRNIDLFEQTKNYFLTAKKLKSWFPGNISHFTNSIDKIALILKNKKWIKPSHLDLMIENVIHTKHGVKLIDWEYAGNADLRFDPAMISFKAKFSKAEDRLLLASHNNFTLRELELMKALVGLREAGWALVQLKTSHIKFNYKKQAITHIARFKKIANKLKL
jgi:thiamine kinase-like enzyme